MATTADIKSPAGLPMSEKPNPTNLLKPRRGDMMIGKAESH